MENKEIPFIRFNHLGEDKKIITNIFGEHIILSNIEFEKYINGEKISKDLESILDEKMFIKKDDNYYEESINYYLRRNQINFIGPTLHIIVLTKGCNHQCKYCHAAADYRYTDDSLMLKKEDSEKIVDIILSSPSKNITIEFQGGEPTANMEILEHIINYTEKQNKVTKKNISYALVSNLTLIDEIIIEKLFSFPNLSISTSIDGDKKTHDFNRLMISDKKSISSFDSVVQKIHFIRKYEKEKGKKILYGAMGVITKKTLTRYKELVDTYIDLGFDSIFLKKINGIGFGEKTKNFLGYREEELQIFYINYYSYLIEKFKEGIIIKDGFLNILMGKIFNPDFMNFMDLRSPCGAGIGQIAYDYTGKIYTCDEGRMVEDDVFMIGNKNDSLKDLVQNEVVGAMMDSSIVESLPCDICAYAPFCGVCPIESYQSRGNIYTNQVFDEHCHFFMFLFNWIFSILGAKKDSTEYDFIMKQMKN